MLEQGDWVAVCGLDCFSCDLRLAPQDAGAAERVVGWFQDMGWLEEGEGLDEILSRSMYCHGCRGDRTVHWSADCWILQCCVDDRELDHCSECIKFPCERLVEWAEGSEAYTRALARLHCMQATGGSAS